MPKSEGSSTSPAMPSASEKIPKPPTPSWRAKKSVKPIVNVAPAICARNASTAFAVIVAPRPRSASGAFGWLIVRAAATREVV